MNEKEMYESPKLEDIEVTILLTRGDTAATSQEGEQSDRKTPVTDDDDSES